MEMLLVETIFGEKSITKRDNVEFDNDIITASQWVGYTYRDVRIKSYEVIKCREEERLTQFNRVQFCSNIKYFRIISENYKNRILKIVFTKGYRLHDYEIFDKNKGFAIKDIE